MDGGDWTNAERPRARRDPVRGRATTLAADRVAVALNAGERSGRRALAGRARGLRLAPAHRHGARPAATAATPVERDADAVDRRAAIGASSLAEGPGRAPCARRRRRRAGSCSTGSPRPPASPANGGTSPARATSSAPDTQARAARGDGSAGADSTGDARERLAALADARERRALPALGRRARGFARVRVAMAHAARRTRHRVTLRLRREDGTEQLLPLRARRPSRERRDGGRRPRRRAAHAHAAAARRPATTRCAFDDEAEPCQPRRGRAASAASCRRSWRDGARRFGLAAHLYALRRHGDQGIGDFTTLARARRRRRRAPAAASSASIRCTRSSPRIASARARTIRPTAAFSIRSTSTSSASPDFAASRRGARTARAAAARASRRSRRGAAVDYSAGLARSSARCSTRASRTSSGASAADPLVAEFDRFVAAGGDAAAPVRAVRGDRRARIRATPWHALARTTLRGPTHAGVADFARAHARPVRFALYLQWLADRQLGAPRPARARERASRSGFYRDLAVGAAPDGAEPWANPGAFARGVSIGAPPDPFSPAGQNWNLPPPIPRTRSLRSGVRRLPRSARRQHAPRRRAADRSRDGARAAVLDSGRRRRGRRRLRPLSARRRCSACSRWRARARAASSSARTSARCPEGLRERLAAADVLSYRVLWFERDGARFTAPSRYPAKAAACVSTHDLPTIAGWWSGTDIAEKRVTRPARRRRRARPRSAERLAAKRALADAIDAPASRAWRAAGRGDAARRRDHRSDPSLRVRVTPSALVLVQADDLAGETVGRSTFPAPIASARNWRRQGCDVDVEGALADAVRHRRRSPISRPRGRVGDLTARLRIGRQLPRCFAGSAGIRRVGPATACARGQRSAQVVDLLTEHFGDDQRDAALGDVEASPVLVGIDADRESVRQPAVLVDDRPLQHRRGGRRRRWAGPPSPRSCSSRGRGRSRTAASGARSSR